MANNCLFTMKICGYKNNVEELIRMLRYENEFAERGLGRVFCAYVLEKNIDGDVASYTVEGDCAWSVNSSMMARSGRERSLESETRRLRLAVEVFSEEPGCGFQEHLLIVNGNVLNNECIDWEEWDYSQMEEEDIVGFCNRWNLSRKELENEQHDFISGGGFGDDYLNFENLFPYVVEEAR